MPSSTKIATTLPVPFAFWQARLTRPSPNFCFARSSTKAATENLSPSIFSICASESICSVSTSTFSTSQATNNTPAAATGITNAAGLRQRFNSATNSSRLAAVNARPILFLLQKTSFMVYLTSIIPYGNLQFKLLSQTTVAPLAACAARRKIICASS